MSFEKKYAQLFGEIEVLKRSLKEEPKNETLIAEIRDKEDKLYRLIILRSRSLRKFLDLYSTDHYND